MTAERKREMAAAWLLDTMDLSLPAWWREHARRQWIAHHIGPSSEGSNSTAQGQ